MSKFEYIYKKVAQIIKVSDTRDPFEICKRLGICIYYRDLGPSLKAFYFYQSRIKNIVINSQIDDTLCRLLCAHELGHAVLHENYAAMRTFHEAELYSMTSPTEYEANIFAAELLIPDDEVLKLIKQDEVCLYDVAGSFAVPCQLLEFKFKILASKYPDLSIRFTPQANFLRKSFSCVN